MNWKLKEALDAMDVSNEDFRVGDFLLRKDFNQGLLLLVYAPEDISKFTIADGDILISGKDKWELAYNFEVHYNLGKRLQESFKQGESSIYDAG